MMNIPEILDSIAEYPAFYTVDEMAAQGKALAQRYPAVISRFSAGQSGNGDDLWCLKLGSGARNALCFACPHPNEPIGAMTLLSLAERLAADPQLLRHTGMTWYLIPCIDPDGTRLNEGWFKGPFGLEAYIRGFYRPPGFRQVEWTFPFRYGDLWFDKPIPETRVLMRLIRELRPALTYSLHNSAVGGAYWYSTCNDAALNAKLENSAARQRVPLHRGDPESPYIRKYSKAVHSMMSLREYYDYRRGLRLALPVGEQSCGTCSGDFVATVCDSLVLMTEVPYFLVQGIDDDTPSGENKRALLRRKAKRKAEHGAFLRRHWQAVEPLFCRENPFQYFVNDMLAAYESMDATLEAEAADDRPATMAEVLDSEHLSRIFEALDAALAIRSCAFALENHSDPAELALLQSTRKALDIRLTAMCREIEDACAYETASIKRLVGVQLESVLLAAETIGK